MPTTDWNSSVTKISASRTRLRKYLIDSRETASGIIQEMLDARAWLENDPALTIDGLKHACVLRREYFEEVPETADFLRPKNPESLFRDRALLVWSDRDSSIRLQLPGLAQDKMPSSWKIGALSHPASVTPSECVLNSAAFQPSLSLALNHGTQAQEQILNGASPWGLFDLERGGILVNRRRDHLPLRSYVLVSEKPITHIEQEGFDDTEAPANQEFHFKDGSPLYVTYLYPKGRSASLSLSIGNHNHKVRFRTRDRVDARLFVGKEGQSGKFMRFDGILTLEKLPLVSVLVPQEYFRDNMATVRQQFKVLIDSRPAGGVWEKAQTKISDDTELFNWRWDTNPLLEKVKTGKIKDFRAIGEFYKSPDLRGKRTLDIVAQHYGIRFSYTINIDASKRELEAPWQNLPGRYLLFFLLAQSEEGMRWDDILTARDIISPDSRISYQELRKYADYGFIALRGRSWQIEESRASLTVGPDNTCTLRFCGDPSIIWGLYRKMLHIMPPPIKLPILSIDEYSVAPDAVAIPGMEKLGLLKEVSEKLAALTLALQNRSAIDELFRAQRALSKKQHQLFTELSRSDRQLRKPNLTPVELAQLRAAKNQAALSLGETTKALEDIMLKLENQSEFAGKLLEQECRMLRKNESELLKELGRAAKEINNSKLKRLPHLVMQWPIAQERELIKHLKSRNVRLVRDIWNP
jgi:hypothetical protein